MPVQRCKRYVFNRVSLNLLTRTFCQILEGKRSFVAPPTTYDLNSTYPVFALYTDTTRIRRKSRKEGNKKRKRKRKKHVKYGWPVCVCVFLCSCQWYRDPGEWLA